MADSDGDDGAVSRAADDILQAGISDARATLSALSEFDGHWHAFTHACHMRQFDLAHVLGDRMIGLVEVAVDLYRSSHKRIAQFENLTKEIRDAAP